MEDFAERILSEKLFSKKVDLMIRFSRSENVLFNHAVVYKTLIAKMFIEIMNIKDVDLNEVITAGLLCTCKKIDNSQDRNKIESYAKESADYLKSLGFSDKFCRICEQHNRYSGNLPREKESEILELADQLGGLLISRPERQAFHIDEAIVLLEYNNLKDVKNNYLELFKKFIDIIKEVQV